MIGRAAELAALRAAWADVQAGRPGVVCVHGAPGFGKTTLVREFLTRAQPAQVLEAVGEADEQRLAFGVIGQLVRGVDAIPDGLAQLGSAGPGATSAAADPLTVGHALLGALEALADAGPVALVIDDVQWADELSVRAVIFALRRLRTEPILAVLAARTQSLPTLPDALVRLLRDTAVQIGVGGFGATELRQLAGRRALTVRAVARLLEHSGGSPLHAKALLEALSDRQLDSASDVPLPAPGTFDELVTARLAAVPAPAADLVRAASVLGGHHELAVLAEVADLQVGGPAEAALDTAQTADLLTRPDRARPIGVSHPLVRSAIYHSLAPDDQRRLHARAAMALADRDPAARLRHRIAAAPDADPQLAEEIVARARQTAAAGGWVQAVDLLASATGLAPNGSALHGAALVGWIQCVALGNNLVEAGRLLGDLERQPPAASRDYLRGLLRTMSAQDRSAASLLVSAWRQATVEGDGATSFAAARALGVYATSTGRLSQASRWFAWLDVAAAECGAAGPPVVVEPWTDGSASVMSLIASGMNGRAAEILAGLPPRPPTTADADWATLQLIGGYGFLRMWTGQLRAAAIDLTDTVTLTDELATTHHRFASWCLAMVSVARGSWDVAQAMLEANVELIADMTPSWTVASGPSAAAVLHANRGDRAAAEAMLAHAEQLLAHLDLDAYSRLWVGLARTALGQAFDDRARLQAGLALLDEVAQPSGRTAAEGVEQMSVFTLLPVYVEGLVAADRIEDAEHALRRYGAPSALADLGWAPLREARVFADLPAPINAPGIDVSVDVATAQTVEQGPLLRVQTLRAAAAILLARRDTEAAAAALAHADARVVSAAAPDGDDRPSGYEDGRTALVAAAVARARGDWPGVEQALARATDGFDAVGARLWSERAVRGREQARERLAAERPTALRAAGATGTAPADSRTDSRGMAARLTAHEAAIATLVAAGLTNRQIASQLSVSVKTIEYHLGNVFAKLNIRSRVQLAALTVGS